MTLIKKDPRNFRKYRNCKSPVLGYLRLNCKLAKDYKCKHTILNRIEVFEEIKHSNGISYDRGSQTLACTNGGIC